MPRPRQSLILTAAGVGVAAALAGAPFAAADDSDNPPGCEVSGSNATTGGQTTDCMSPGNAEIDVKPPSASDENAFFGFPAFGFI